jgi:hypothetical protein
MAVQALFDKNRRDRVREALKKGDVIALIKHRKPAPDSMDERRALRRDQLTLGLQVKIGGFGFRYIGVDGKNAIVMVEKGNGNDGKARKVHVKIGRKEMKDFNPDATSPAYFTLEAKEARDVSGQDVVTVTVRQESRD